MNNCATFILDTMKYLDISVTEDVIEHVAEKLAETQGMVLMLKNSTGVDAFMTEEEGSSLADKEIMQRFVSHYVKQHNALA